MHQKTAPFGSGHIHLVQGDITEMQVEAIVNAANAQLILGGGVAGAIRRKGGPSIQQECNKIGGTFVGGAVLTGAGDLPAKYIIHAVGPRMGEGNEDEKLTNATINSLKLAEENYIHSIAFPAISTGIFGYPVDRCAEIMVKASADFLADALYVKDIYFCLWEEESYHIFEDKLFRLL
ncbi:MAG TPA: macro domain-containing protein [Calditrichaeota bacterium]|nr:macro domain-containing protein [Calditrichota bacterium]